MGGILAKKFFGFWRWNSFKSCPRVGGIKQLDAVEQQINRFQVVPPCGGHPGHDHRISRHGDVSSRAPVWGASCRNWKRSWRTQFQVVPPCGGHHFRSISLKPLNLFQVVPPCGGHHFLVPVCIHDHAVSSRAPVWGASHPQATAGIRPRFQVVPPCGGHPWLWMMVELSICFKSCPRVGGIFHCQFHTRDRNSFKSCPRVGGICFYLCLEAQPECFKSCPRVGGILSLSLMFCFFAMFQVVPPCGGHPMASLSWPRMPMFQVVPPCGGHPLLLSSSIVAKGFKSCPRVGGIRPAPPLPGGLGGFKSCPRVGGILRRLPGSRACPVSSRAPVWGASGHS